jgi:hypothetical protein
MMSALPTELRSSLNYITSTTKLVVRVGFEPTNSQGEQIYSLSLLTTRPPDLGGDL